MKRLPACLLSLCLLGPAFAWADQNYSQQVFFDNSLSPDSYFYSAGTVTAPSMLRLIAGKLPVTTSDFISAPNALQLQWNSAVNGGWSAEVKLYAWRDREVLFLERSFFSGCMPRRICPQRACRILRSATKTETLPSRST